MIVDLEEKEESGWFDLRDGGRVNLRLLSIADFREIRKATSKAKAEYPLLDGKYQRFEAVDFDADLFNEMRLDRNIIGWEKLFDRNEKEIPVTKGNKVLLMERSTEFRDAVENGLKALQEAEKARSEAAEKNSLPSQNG